jgi:hypothetical protein
MHNRDFFAAFDSDREENEQHTDDPEDVSFTRIEPHMIEHDPAKWDHQEYDIPQDNTASNHGH